MQTTKFLRIKLLFLKRVHTHAKRLHTHVKDPAVHVRVSMHYGNIKITQHALKVSVFRLLKLDAIRKKNKKKKNEEEEEEEEKSGVRSVLTRLRVLSNRPRLANRHAQARRSHSFDRQLYRTCQNQFLSVNSRSPKGTR